MPIMPLDEFLKLESDEQVEKLKRWKTDYTLKDIREAWGFKHSAQYYMLLKKLRIYERVVNKSDKFYPDQLAGSNPGTGEFAYMPREVKLPADQFGYQLNVSLTGPELADKLERLAQFLRGEQKLVNVKLSVEAAAEETAASEAAPEKEAV
ncbi:MULTISPECIES: hypothetical protein [unclassified Paenibacillus]|uniref:hypothetical protein n=2 Tax=Paenibacillus TaxID=44249 RepID=UPI000390035A|nr:MULTISPECIES: hypothetical protein [unclassified Paenibacillus]KKC47569.1 hypothetical protein VE23_11160 [Paenibacillus sp. D9]CDN45855.1 Putative uncharacterized protein [Paenibacillus sp. P22]